MGKFLKKRFLGIPLGIIIALLVFGVALAAWLISYLMQGTVATGDVKSQISLVESWDPPGSNDPDWFNGSQGPDYSGGTTARHDFDQGCTEVSISGNVITFTVTNAYPDYVGGATLKLINTGNVPLKVTGLTFDGDTGVLDVTLIDISENASLGAGQYIIFGLGIHVTPDINPNTTYSFSVNFNVEYDEDGW